MADTCITTSNFPRQTRNLAAGAFDVLNHRLHHLYQSELDCVGLPDGDRAFDQWLREAEAKRQATLSAARVVMVMPSTAAQSSLCDLASGLIDLFEATDASIYAAAAQDLLSASPVTAQIVEFQNHLARLLTLPDYAPAELPGLNELSLAA